MRKFSHFCALFPAEVGNFGKKIVKMNIYFSRAVCYNIATNPRKEGRRPSGFPQAYAQQAFNASSADYQAHDNLAQKKAPVVLFLRSKGVFSPSRPLFLLTGGVFACYNVVKMGKGAENRGGAVRDKQNPRRNR